MPVAGNIVANLTANTTGWTSGFAAAMGPLNAMGAAVGAFTVAGVVRFMQVGSALDDMSQRTGVTAESLSRLNYAAQMTDVTQAGLQAGLMKMAIFLDNVSQGSDGAANTLQRLGITTAELAGLSPDKQFAVFAEALSQIDNTGQRAAVAMQVFGKGAIELLPLLSEGASGIATMGEEAERLGLVMSSETAANAALLSDSFDKLILQASFFAINIGAELAPILMSAMELFSWLASFTNGWGSAIIITGAAVATFLVTMKAVTLATQIYTTTMAIAQAVTSPAGFIKVAAGMALAGVAVAGLNEHYKNLSSSSLAATSDQKATALASASVSASAAAQQAAISKLSSSQESLKRAYFKTLPVGFQTAKQNREMERDWYAARDAGVELGVTLEQLKTLQSQTVLDASGWQDMFTGVTDELAILRGDITKTEQQFQKMAEAGVPEKQIEKLRQAVAERDKLTKAAELEKKSQDENKKRLESITSRVQDNSTSTAPLTDIVKQLTEARQLQSGTPEQTNALSSRRNPSTSDPTDRLTRNTPAAGTPDTPASDSQKIIDAQLQALHDSLAASVQQFRSLTTEVNDAVNAGTITADQGAAFLADEQLKLRTQIEKDLQSGNQQPQQKAQALNEAMTVNSDGANRQLVSLLNRRGAESQVAKQVDLAKEANTYLAELKAIGERQEAALLARTPTKSKPFGGRAS